MRHRHCSPNTKRGWVFPGLSVIRNP
ncbi:DUF1317 family protein, partial [Escherichia sp. HC-CC]